MGVRGDGGNGEGGGWREGEQEKISGGSPQIVSVIVVAGQAHVRRLWGIEVKEDMRERREEEEE